MGERSSNRLGIYVLMGRGTTDCRFNSINVDCDEEQMFKCLNLEMFTASIFQIVDIEWTDNQRRSRTVGRYSWCEWAREDTVYFVFAFAVGANTPSSKVTVNWSAGGDPPGILHGQLVLDRRAEGGANAHSNFWLMDVLAPEAEDGVGAGHHALHLQLLHRLLLCNLLLCLVADHAHFVRKRHPVRIEQALILEHVLITRVLRHQLLERVRSRVHLRCAVVIGRARFGGLGVIDLFGNFSLFGVVKGLLWRRRAE